MNIFCVRFIRSGDHEISQAGDGDGLGARSHSSGGASAFRADWDAAACRCSGRLFVGVFWTFIL